MAGGSSRKRTESSCSDSHRCRSPGTSTAAARFAFGRAISQEQRLIGLADAVDNAKVGNWERMQVSREWELIFSKPREAGANPVLKHAKYIGGSGS